MSTYILGRGMVGSAISFIDKDAQLIGRSIVDLTDQISVNKFFGRLKPKKIYLCAAKVGGINANQTYPAEFIYENLMIQSNVIHAAYKYNTEKLLFIGSSCIYPKHCQQPIDEDYLLTGELEKTNEPYAIAKIAGLKMIEAYRKQYKVNFISCMPTNLYGEGDNYDLDNNHVIPALIKKIVTAKYENLDSVEIWGDGSPLREFLHVKDFARACKFLMDNYNDDGHINVGSGDVYSINEVAMIICDILNYYPKFKHLLHMPNGTKEKTLNSNKINALGWKSEIGLVDGLRHLVNLYAHELQRKSKKNIRIL
jgi:GDP-L-fucose synthase